MAKRKQRGRGFWSSLPGAVLRGVTSNEGIGSIKRYGQKGLDLFRRLVAASADPRRVGQIAAETIRDNLPKEGSGRKGRKRPAKRRRKQHGGAVVRPAVWNPLPVTEPFLNADVARPSAYAPRYLWA